MPKQELPPGITREQWDRHQARVGATEEANAKPLPGPLREAFAGEPRRVLGYELLPVTAGTEILLTRVESPLLPTFGIMLAHRDKGQKEIQKLLEKKVKPAPESLVETVYCFVRPGRELRALLDKGRVAFREAAMAELGDKLNPLQLMKLYQACAEHYAAAFVTAVQYEAAPQEGGTVFTAPPAELTTGSAGGPTSSTV